MSEKIRGDAQKWMRLKNLGFTLSHMFLQLAGISFLAYFIHSAKQDEQLKKLKEQQLISELTYLKAQLQPHFFFNTLNNIYSLALKQDKDTAPLVAKLAEMMRYMLYKSNEVLVLLREEVDFIQNYIDVERIRYRSEISITYDVQGIDNETKISPLILLPFIENAFKHGVEQEEKKGFVSIIICKTENELVLEVENSIADLKKSEGGIGIVNVMKRLEILYPQRHRLNIQLFDDVYKVSLVIEMD